MFLKLSKKIRLNSKERIQPFSLSSFFTTKPDNDEQRYTFYRTADMQNFHLKYFYGESTNAIKIQIWVTLIANLLLMVLQKGLKRQWNFSGLATMVRITLMYYVDFYSLFNNPEKDW